MATLDEKHLVGSLLHIIDDPVIVELGAHIGEEEPWIRHCCKTPPKYIMVEPDPANQMQIRKNIFNFNHTLYSGAISDKNGTSEFYRCDNTLEPVLYSHGSGSIHKPTGHLRRFPHVLFDKPIMVKSFTLDHIFEKEKLSKIDLLWVDIQGAEKEMIAGGRKALKHTRYLFMEAEFEELYEGEALKTDLISLLPDWSLIQDFDYNIVLRNEKMKK